LFQWKFSSVLISSSGITAKSKWPGYPKKIGWDEITKVSRNPILESFVITGNHKTVNISQHFKGIQTFLDELKTRVAKEKFNKAYRY
jgi:hypothetical protein